MVLLATRALTPGIGPGFGHGIIPRAVHGLDGIPLAAFIHINLEHLVSNSVPLVVLGPLILLRGVDAFLFVVLV